MARAGRGQRLVILSDVFCLVILSDVSCLAKDLCSAAAGKLHRSFASLRMTKSWHRLDQMGFTRRPFSLVRRLGLWPKAWPGSSAARC
jgi:hypothetical protein